MKRHERMQQRLRDKPPTPYLLSIAEAAAKGIDRLRQPQWADPLDHLKIDIIGGLHGPWAHLFCPFNKECNGRDPVDILMVAQRDWAIDPSIAAFMPYTGPLPDSDEYKAAAARFEGALRTAGRAEG